VKVWDAVAGSEALTLEGHVSQVGVVAWGPDGRRLASANAGGPAVKIWDLTSLNKAELPRSGPLSLQALQSLWADLAGADARKARQAIWALAAAPEASVPFLRERVRPAVPADADRRIGQLLADLDSEEFAVREEATTELARLGRAAEPALRKAFQGPPSQEVRRRVERLVEELDRQPLPPEQLRLLRAVEVLEQAGGPAAREVLQTLARGAPDAPLTRQAKSALGRLSQHASPGPGPG
jgi:hypothetical protein